MRLHDHEFPDAAELLGPLALILGAPVACALAMVAIHKLALARLAPASTRLAFGLAALTTTVDFVTLVVVTWFLDGMRLGVALPAGAVVVCTHSLAFVVVARVRPAPALLWGLATAIVPIGVWIAMVASFDHH